MKRYLLYILLAIVFAACSKNRELAIFTHLDLPEGVEVKNLYFLSSDHVYACAGSTFNYGMIYKSVDGGNNWEKVVNNVPETCIYDLVFINDSVSIAGADYLHFFKTTNQWKDSVHINWAPWMPENILQYLPVRNIFDIGSGRYMFIGGTRYSGGSIGISSDSCKTWDYQLYNHEFRDLHFLNDQLGYIAGHGLILKTQNGGLDYDSLDIAGDFYVGIHAINANELVVAGNTGKIYRSADGGKSFKTVYSKSFLGDQVNLHHLEFIDDLTGYAVGNYGLVLKTGDGGKSWFKLKGFPKTNLNKVEIGPGNTVYFCGEKGLIIKLSQ